MKKTLAILLVLCMVLTILPIPALAAGTEVASGTCGDNLTWTLDEEGTLIISGSGAMENYTGYQDTPWYSHRDQIIRVWVQEGVTTLGDYAFYAFGYVLHQAVQ